MKRLDRNIIFIFLGVIEDFLENVKGIGEIFDGRKIFLRKCVVLWMIIVILRTIKIVKLYF